MDNIKTIRIKKCDWDKLFKLAALKQLATTNPVPLHDVISDLIDHRKRLEYYTNKGMCRLKGHKIT